MTGAARRTSSAAGKRTPRGGAVRFPLPDLYAEMRRLVRQIPPGQVATYGGIAEALGDVRAARWVATCLLDERCPADLPAHRVVLKDGRLGTFRGATAHEKALRLRAEGIDVTENRIDLELCRFAGFKSKAPLARLQHRQENLLEKLSLVAPRHVPEFVGGVDVSYGREIEPGHDEAVAAFARIELATGRLDWSTTSRGIIRFPYIPGFLAFREMPLLLQLLDQVREAGKLTELVLVDGNGILHHRHAGIATHLGIIAGIRTIGVGKSLLCGSVDLRDQRVGERRPVSLDGRIVATAVRTGKSRKPIYISPGQGVDVKFATDIACRALHGHRVPEPIYHAHHVSRAAVKAVQPEES